MKRIRFIIFYLITLALISCQKEMISTIPNQLVLNSLFSTDSTFRVSISRSMNMTDTNNWFENRIDDAQVLLYENGILLESLNSTHFNYWELGPYLSTPQAIPNYFSKTIIPKPGNQYKISVQKQGYPNIEAVTTIPKPVAVQIIDTVWYREEHYVTDTLDNIMIGMTPRLMINIQFIDPINDENFYLIEMIGKCEYHYRDTVISSNYSIEDFDSNNPIYDVIVHNGSGKYGVVFTDKGISGQKVRLKLSPDWKITTLEQGKDPLFGMMRSIHQTFCVKLYSITKDYYLYVKTLDKYNEDRKSPFYPPVQIHSNVVGGLGIFAGASVSSALVTYNKTW